MFTSRRPNVSFRGHPIALDDLLFDVFSHLSMPPLSDIGLLSIRIVWCHGHWLMLGKIAPQNASGMKSSWPALDTQSGVSNIAGIVPVPVRKA
jgi:hypothetical protein